MDEVKAELASLRALVERQQQRISQLEERVAAAARPEMGETPTRRQLLTGAALAVAAGVALAPTSPADAADGQAVIAGSYNNIETHPCALTYRGAAGGIDGKIYGFGVVDQTLDAYRLSAGVAGHTAGSFEIGVLGDDTSGPPGKIGVGGYSDNGIGVFGGSANVGIQARGRRRGLSATAFGGGLKSIAVYAGVEVTNPSNPGTALVVDGVFRAKRVGLTSVPAGVRSKVVNLRPLTNTSLVIATAQKLAGTVAVQAVTVNTTSTPSFTITLTAPAPAGGMPVAWFVVDTIGTALS